MLREKKYADIFSVLNTWALFVTDYIFSFKGKDLL
jgi:hypothetical protein